MLMTNVRARALFPSAKTMARPLWRDFGCIFAITAPSITTVHRCASAMLVYIAYINVSSLIRRRGKNKMLITKFQDFSSRAVLDVRHDAGGMRDKLASDLLNSVLLESFRSPLETGLDPPDF